MAERSKRVEEEVLDEYEDREMEIRNDGTDCGCNGDAESGGGDETDSERETGERDAIGLGRGLSAAGDG